MAVRRRRRGLSMMHFKVIGLVLIALSAFGGTVVRTSLAAAGGDDMGLMTTGVICEVVSWAAAPLYAWMLVEGYRHSHSRWLYAARLLALAVISEVPYDLATSGRVVDWTSQNPVFALLVALAAVALIDWIGARYSGATRWVLTVVIVLAALLWVLILHLGVRQQLMNLGVVIVGMAVIFLLLQGRENTMMFSAGLFGAAMFVLPAAGVALLHYRREDDTQVPFRWLFYVLYPVVLLLFVGVNLIV